MSQRVSLINGKNKNQDYDLAKIFQSLGNAGVSEGLEVQPGKVTKGFGFVNITRDGKTFPVLFSLDEDLTFDTNGTKKVFIEINQANIDDGSMNNPDGTGIGNIKSGNSYPAFNYIPLANITSGIITDERIFIKGLFAKTTEENTFGPKQTFGDIQVNNANITNLKYGKYNQNNVYVGVVETGDGSGRDTNNYITLANALKMASNAHITNFLLQDGEHNITHTNFSANEYHTSFPLLYIIGSSRANCTINFETFIYNGKRRNTGINIVGGLYIRHITIKNDEGDTSYPWEGNTWYSALFRMGYGSGFAAPRENQCGAYIRECDINIANDYLFYQRDSGVNYSFYNNSITREPNKEIVNSFASGGTYLPLMFNSDGTPWTKKITKAKVGQNLLTNITDTNLVDYAFPPQGYVVSASNALIFDLASFSVSSGSVKGREVVLNTPGTYRIHFRIMGDTGSGTCSCTVKKNGTDIYTGQYDDSNSGAIHEFDYTFSAGDVVSFWGNEAGDTAQVSEIEIKGTLVDYNVTL